MNLFDMVEKEECPTPSPEYRDESGPGACPDKSGQTKFIPLPVQAWPEQGRRVEPCRGFAGLPQSHAVGIPSRLIGMAGCLGPTSGYLIFFRPLALIVVVGDSGGEGF